MLIINADDFGRDAASTDNALECYRKGVVTSVSAMVFMADSKRAAEYAIQTDIESGLHLNLTMPFDGPKLSARLMEYHSSIARYLCLGKWAQVFYNPFLKRYFSYVFRAQYEEYCCLYGKKPLKIDGHRHMHLCMNMIVNREIPVGTPVRRSFTFRPGEKSVHNLLYRRLIDAWINRHFKCLDLFYSIDPVEDEPRLRAILSLARSFNVELMVHPASAKQYALLMSGVFNAMIRDLQLGSFQTM